jgi:ABC-2 type transport system permease protein
MDAVATLLECKATMLLRQISDLRGRVVARNLSALLIAGGFAVGMFLFVRLLTGLFLMRLHVSVGDLYQVVSVVLLLFYLSIHLINLVVAYATLYQADELPFLFSFPVLFEQVFIARMVENFVTSSGLLTLVALAALLGFWSFFGLPWYAYVAAMFLAFLPFVLSAATAAVILLMGLIVLAYRIGVRWMLVVAGLSYVVGTYALYALVRPMDVIQALVRSHATPSVLEVVAPPDILRLFPHEWVRGFLQQSSQANILAGLPSVLLLYGLLAVTVWLAWKIAARYYFPTWMMAAELRSRDSSMHRTTLVPFMAFDRPSSLPVQMVSLCKRDFWMFVRDPMQRLHLLMMGMLIVTFLWTLQSFEVPSLLPDTRVAGVIMLFLFDGFLLASLALRFVFPAVSMEGSAFWSVRTAPVSLSRLYWMKFGIAALFMMAMALCLVLAAFPIISFHPAVRVLFGGATLLVGMGISSVNIGAGAYFSSLKESNPLQVASSQGASLTFLATIVYLVLMTGALAVPVQVYSGLLRVEGQATTSTFLAVGTMTFFTLSLSVAVHTMGLRSIQRDL